MVEVYRQASVFAMEVGGLSMCCISGITEIIQKAWEAADQS